MSLTRVGGDLLKQPLNIGTGVTITPDGNATFSGIVTAGNLVGSDGKPIASGAGLGTAVVAGSDEGGEQIYYTNTVLNITDNLTIDPPDSANASYTQYQEVAVEQGKDLIVEDDFIVDVLGISSSVVTPLPGQGGRVRADRFTNKAGTGAPIFPNGIEVSTDATIGGGLTVTNNLTVDGNLVVNGSETSLKTAKLQVDDINIGIAPFDNKLSDGQLNGAGFTINGLNGDKSLTWDNPNDRMAFSTDLYAPRMYADSVTADDSITVGDTFLKSNQVGLGSVTTAGRDAGIGTAIGTLVYNSQTGQVEGYGPVGWVSLGSLNDEGMTATGGVISDYQEGNKIYRSHTFASSGYFDVTKLSSQYSNSIDLMMVGGGGAGAGSVYGLGGGGGGGAGGLKYIRGVLVAESSYSIVIGAGGASRIAPANGSDGGTTSAFGNSVGGGGGGGRGSEPSASVGSPGVSGGSGGGGGYRGYSNNANGGGSPGNGGGTNNSVSPSNGWGNDGGGVAAPSASGAGGGGAGGAGQSNTGSGGGTGGVGGVGLSYSINGTSITYASGGQGGSASPSKAGAPGTGNGGTGRYGNNNGSQGDDGGSGIVVVRYQIGSSQTSATQSARATGGLVSYANGKTIHQFTSAGTFEVTDSSLTSVEYIVIAGGGGGGRYNAGNNYGGGGGGGAGGYRSSITGETSGGGGSVESALPVSPGPYTVTVGAGGAGAGPEGGAISGLQGSDSSFHTVVSGGGGFGSGEEPVNGNPGGSGGGGAGGPSVASSGGSGTANQGYAGGDAVRVGGVYSAGGQGGGAGAVGIAYDDPDRTQILGYPQAYIQGSSPNGLASSATGITTTRAQGGHGMRGYGPGGNSQRDGIYGRAYHGDGGGGSEYGRGGQGGSGTVIIVYPT